MNAILEKWLAERRAEEEKSRKDFLIKQGLIDPTKTSVIFKDVLGNILTEEEAQEKEKTGAYVYKHLVNDALDLTDEEYNQVLTHARPQAFNDGEPTDHELLKRIETHTKVVSIIMIVSVILSVIAGIIVVANMG